MLLRIRTSSGIAKGGRNTTIDPKIPLMAPPHEVDISKYVGLFQQFHTVPHVWEQTTLTDAWSAVYRELHGAANEAAGLSRDGSPRGSDEIDSEEGASSPSLEALEAKTRLLRSYDVTGLSRLSSNLEISRILLLLPDRIREAISRHPRFRLGELEEIFLHVGMPIEVRGEGWTFSVEHQPIEEEAAAEVDSAPASSSLPAANVDGDGYVENDDNISSSTLAVAEPQASSLVPTKKVKKRRSYLLATAEEILHIQNRISPFGSDGRSSLPGTLHRISAYRGKNGKDVVGFTIRVGKYISNAGRALINVIKKGNLLILSRPSVGKTTLLRDLAVQASLLPHHPRVIIIDTSCEIGGDNITPLPFMNRVRRILVRDRKLQSEAMLDALQNHSPDYIIVDEIANASEADAAYTIAQRGVKLIATCHAETLETLLQNSQLNRLVGGVSQAFLSNEERRLKGKTKKSVLERPLSSPFKFVVEVPSRARGIIYTDVNLAVDKLLDDGSVRDLRRSRFEIALDEDLPSAVDRIVSGVNERNTTSRRDDNSDYQQHRQQHRGYQQQYGSDRRRAVVDDNNDDNIDYDATNNDDDDGGDNSVLSQHRHHSNSGRNHSSQYNSQIDDEMGLSSRGERKYQSSNDDDILPSANRNTIPPRIGGRIRIE